MYYNLSSNTKNNEYKFENGKLEKIFATLDCYYTGTLDKAIVDGEQGYLFSPAHDILSTVGDLLISADKSLLNKNLASCVSSMSIAYEWILKYTLIVINHIKDEKTLNSAFQNWEEIKLFKLEKKILDSMEEPFTSYFKKYLNANLFNEMKHLNNISVVMFHRLLASETGKNIEKIKNYYLDCIQLLWNAMNAMLISIAKHEPHYLTSNDYVDCIESGIAPTKNIQFAATPWFDKYVKEELKDFQNDILSGDFIKFYVDKELLE